MGRACRPGGLARDPYHLVGVHLLRGGFMAVTSKRERALQVALVVLGLLTIVANIYPLVTSLLALRPTGGTTAPMVSTLFATLRRFLWPSRPHPSPPPTS